jgi:integrase
MHFEPPHRTLRGERRAVRSSHEPFSVSRSSALLRQAPISGTSTQRLTNHRLIGALAFREAHNTLLERAGKPEMRFHDLRHTCASLLLAQGVGPRTTMEVLRHSQISLTMDTYSHVMPKMQRQAADMMERLLRATGS